MHKPVLALLSVSALVGATGCDNRLTPDSVRELLDEPRGEVTPGSMAKVTRDLFRSSGATAAEEFAEIFKLGQGDSGGTSNALPISTGVMEDIGDVFCIGGLVTDLAAFDNCDPGGDCKEELILDSCLMRVGDGDSDARGRFIFKIDNSVSDTADISKLGIEMDGWQNSRDEATLSTLAGRIDLETIIAHDDNSVEVVFASDFDAAVKRKERGFFDDGIEEQVQMSAGLRFSAEQSDDSASGSLEVLTFVDEGDGRQESVNVSFAAEGHRFSAEEATANADLSVTGTNGSFVCTWTASSSRAGREGLTVESAGQCTDENGEVFSFEDTATETE
jgi:hypothetical protein